jgi:hypothetical protein
MTPSGPGSTDPADRSQCIAQNGTALCISTESNLVRFDLSQWGAWRKFSPSIERFRREFEDSLRLRFGSEQVRECDMKVERDPDRKSNWWRKYNRVICVPKPRSSD